MQRQRRRFSTLKLTLFISDALPARHILSGRNWRRFSRRLFAAYDPSNHQPTEWRRDRAAQPIWRQPRSRRAPPRALARQCPQPRRRADRVSRLRRSPSVGSLAPTIAGQHGAEAGLSFAPLMGRHPAMQTSAKIAVITGAGSGIGRQPRSRCSRTDFRWCSPGAVAKCWKRRPHSPRRRRPGCLWCRPTSATRHRSRRCSTRSRRRMAGSICCSTTPASAPATSRSRI